MKSRCETSSLIDRLKSENKSLKNCNKNLNLKNKKLQKHNEILVKCCAELESEINHIKNKTNKIEQKKDNLCEFSNELLNNGICTSCVHFVGCECFDGEVCDQYKEVDNEVS